MILLYTLQVAVRAVQDGEGAEEDDLHTIQRDVGKELDKSSWGKRSASIEEGPAKLQGSSWPLHLQQTRP